MFGIFFPSRRARRVSREDEKKTTSDYFPSGSAQYSAVSVATATLEVRLKPLTFSRIFSANDLSSISRKPVPSTSQTPACAMFHNPVFSDPRKPTAKKRGSAITARADAG